MLLGFCYDRPMPKTRIKHLLKNPVLALGIVSVIAAGLYYIATVHKVGQPVSAEFIELKRQEKALSLPKPWRYEATDKGHWMSSPGSGEPATINSYSRSISLSFKSSNTEILRKQFVASLTKNGWRSVEDPFKDWDRGPESAQIYQASREFFRKTGPQGRMCAIVETEYNANYQKSGPWLLELSILGKTDAGCPK